MFHVLFAAFAALCLLVAPAYAETTVDLSGAIGPVLEGVFAIVAAALVWLARKGIGVFEDKINIELDEQMKDRIEAAIIWGVEYGHKKAQRLTASHSVIDVQNETIAQAVSYVIKSVPDSLNYFGITEDRLRDMIEARMGVDLDGDGDIAGVPV
jgi:hypothetical protein